MKIAFALCSLLPLATTTAEARRTHYGGVAEEYCNKTGCHVNEHYMAQLKRRQERFKELLAR